jgi:hypothetical protein
MFSFCAQGRGQQKKITDTAKRYPLFGLPFFLPLFPTEDDSFFRSPKSHTANAVAKDIRPGKGSSDEGGQDRVILPSQQLHNVYILRRLHQSRKEENICRQSRYTFGNSNSAQAAKQHGYQYIANIRPDEIIVDKQRNDQFHAKERDKDDCIQDSPFSHRRFTAFPA